jgi:hypothetical protein
MFGKPALDKQRCYITIIPQKVKGQRILPIPGEAKATAMPGRLNIHTRNKINK